MHKILIIVFALIVSAGCLFAQESSGKQYVLEEVVFDIDGLTNENALIRSVELEVGSSFDSEEELIDYLDRKRQDMVNKRVFDTVAVVPQRISDNGNTALYRATYTVVDSWTFIPIAYPKYNSNTGFRIGLQMYYDNAFGTLTDWFLGMNYDFGTNEYRINPTVSGVDLLGLTWSFSAAQSYNVSEKTSGGVPIAKWSYHQSSIGFGSGIKLFGPFSYGFGPSFSFRYAYDDKLGAGGFTKDYFDFGYRHNVGLSQIDWIENYRDGYSAGISHSISVVNREGRYEVVNGLSVGGSYYWRINRIMNFYTRAGYDIVFNDEMTGYGSKIRGVGDSDLYGFQGAYVNATMAFQFWRWVGVWDAQIHPFIDAGIADPKSESFRLEDDLKMGFGADFVLYIDKLKNLVARGTIGYDLTSDLPKTDSGRLEIIITSELHY